MSPAEIVSIVFHTDTGSCFSTLRDRVSSDTDIFNTSEEFRHLNRKHTERIIKEARADGLLEGHADWLKVTTKGWATYRAIRG